MPKDVSSFDLTLGERRKGQTVTRWLHAELRRAIIEGRLRPGTRLPATRDFALQYGVSRGTAVTVFEQMVSDGYLQSQVGSGTWVNDLLPETAPSSKKLRSAGTVPPEPLSGLLFRQSPRPFRLHEPDISEFPIKIWARVASRRLRSLGPSLLRTGDARGYAPLREAIADYLGSVRGVKCSPDQIVMTSGVQQGLGLLARVLVKPGDSVWMEDPGYFGAAMAFNHAGAKIIPVPVDNEGITIPAWKQSANSIKCAYVTPAHQFPLGMTMSIGRRLELLAWAAETGAFIIEDDYDSEFRFEGMPVSSLQGLDRNGKVILLGSFNKLMFPSLRLGYAVLPPELLDRFLAFRYGIDLHGMNLDQAILCDFMVDGHLGRHIRRMRDLYGGRLTALQEGGRKYLAGLLEISPIQAGLYTIGHLRNQMTSKEAEAAATAHEVETMGIHRFSLGRADVRGLLLGFAAFPGEQIRAGLENLAAALESPVRGQL